MDFTTILNIPILQALGVVTVIAIAERAGLPLVSMLKSLLKINGKSGEEETPQWAQDLKTHYNEDTTVILQSIKETLATGFTNIDNKLDIQCKKLDAVVNSQVELREDGKEWRSEAREFMRDINKR